MGVLVTCTVSVVFFIRIGWVVLGCWAFVTGRREGVLCAIAFTCRKGRCCWVGWLN